MIYFIQQGKEGPIKIGYTQSRPQERLNSLQVGSHEKLRLLSLIDGNTNIEKLLHNFFHGSRLQGEWFKPTPFLLGFILSTITGEPIEVTELEPQETITKQDVSLIGTLDETLARIEIMLIKDALKECNWMKMKAASKLGISFRSLRYKIQKHNIKENRQWKSSNVKSAATSGCQEPISRLCAQLASQDIGTRIDKALE